MVPTDIEIDGPTIRLGQLLKLAGLIDSGGEARAVLGAGLVTVNGAVEIRRGRQVGHDDLVVREGTGVRVVVAGGRQSGGPDRP